MKKNKKGFSPIILGIIILVVIIIVSIAIFAASNSNNSNKSDYDSSFDYEDEMLNKPQLNRKDISKIVVDEKEYDLTKTLRNLGISVDSLRMLSTDKIVEYEELKGKTTKVSDGYWRTKDNSISYYESSDWLNINDENICNSVTLKPGQTVNCHFYAEETMYFGTGSIVNDSNSNKNILDCNIQSWKNVWIVGGDSLNGLAIGETTREEVIKKYKKYVITNEYSDDVEIECKDGSKVTFRFHDEDSSVSNPGTISYIEIELQY